jgi:hypothetical protein
LDPGFRVENVLSEEVLGQNVLEGREGGREGGKEGEKRKGDYLWRRG